MSNHYLSDEEKALFREAVNKLSQTSISQTKTCSLPTIELTDTCAAEIKADTSLYYCKGSLPHRYLQSFKKGQLSIEARLDLHGFKIQEAKEALIHFIYTQIHQGHRVCLLIHGKGGQTPVLKNLINHWLPQFPEVLAFVSAIPRHGGTGAMYVLLKRR